MKKIGIIGALIVLNSQTAEGKSTKDKAALEKEKPEWHQRKGMRFGYAYVNNGAESRYLANSNMFTIGFETQQAMKGGDWLDLLFIQNVNIGGLEQSVILPSVNALVGFEINQRLQLGVGANATLSDPSGEDNYLHLVTAAGWTQPAGYFSVPIHFVYIPDVNGYWRVAATTGVNW